MRNLNHPIQPSVTPTYEGIRLNSNQLLTRSGIEASFSPMDIPWEQLKPEILRAVIEEYVSREGTDYGTQEISFETKVKQVHQLIQSGKVKIVFDAETESCDLREVKNEPKK